MCRDASAGRNKPYNLTIRNKKRHVLQHVGRRNDDGVREAAHATIEPVHLNSRDIRDYVSLARATKYDRRNC